MTSKRIFDLTADPTPAEESLFKTSLSGGSGSRKVTLAELAAFFPAVLKSATGLFDFKSTAIKGAIVSINEQTGTTYELVLDDGGKLVTLDNAAAVTLTIPDSGTVAYAIGERIELAQLGAGQVTIASAATINSKDGLVALTGQYSGATLTQTAVDVWLLVGDLA